MQAAAVGWHLYADGARATQAGGAGAPPGILLFLAAGHAADHFHRRRIMQVCYIGFALCSVALLGLSLFGLSSVYPVYAVLLANGVVRAFIGPATQALLPQILAEDHFANGVAWSSSISQAAMVTGPMLGGIVYGLAGSPQAVYVAPEPLPDLASLISRVR
jgi:MFS family permease